MSKTYMVRDGARSITFEGAQLAEVSSERSTSPRWTDMALYKTESGKYVLTKIGRTRVLHETGCPGIIGKLNLYMDEYPNTVPEEGNFDFHTCVGETYYIDEILVEQTRYWAYIADNARAVIDILHRNEGGVRSLPRLSITLLEEAALHDSEISKAYSVEHI